MREKLPLIPALTGIRFVAALWVVTLHSQMSSLIEYPHPLDLLVSHGRAGVSLFFVLSGFLMAYHYGGWFKHDIARAREYWQGRFARVYPMYLVATLCVAAPCWLLSHDQYPPPHLDSSW